MELLAPANTKTFFECINNRADAVYLGLNEFSARASADNITLENLDYYVSYAHLFGVKVYCAVNTLIKNSELKNFISLIINAYNKGVDAFILQDVFLGKYLKEQYPEIELHLSTQAGVNNIQGASFLASCFLRKNRSIDKQIFFLFVRFHPARARRKCYNKYKYGDCTPSRKY